MGLTEEISGNLGDWLGAGLNREAVQKAQRFGEELNKEGLSTSQIRNVFGKVKKMEMRGFGNFDEQEFLLLKPQLAYVSRKDRKGGPTKDLREVLSKGIDHVLEGNGAEEKGTRFDNFCKFFEAILAYHRAAGGS